LHATPLLQLNGMPRSAQAFPEKETLAKDRAEDLAIHQCPGCGLVQLVRKPVHYYREVIRASAYSPAMSEFRRRQFDDWITRFNLENARVLEVGCGRGEYLTLLRQAGTDASGIEWSPGNLKACRAAGLTAHRAFPTRPGQILSESPFAAFACFNFMEHWPDPIGSLAAIHNNLQAGGIGLIEVPNFDMILEKALYAEFISDHLSYFTQDTLRFTLQMAGFEILETHTIWQDYILSAVIRKRQTLDIARLTSQQIRLQEHLKTFVAGFPSQQVAVWGAGHQALAAIALSGIAPQIRYVIDSAPFKQGKFTPATHLPIVAPRQLTEDPVRAVIIMAAAYSDEVARQIRTQFSPTLTVSILRDDHLETV
jgi:SAM-dependent methyltransferase